MAFRFFKRIQILPGVYLNFGKNCVSISIGPRGCKTTIGRKGVKLSIGIPGTGIRYETGYKPILSNEIEPNTPASRQKNCTNVQLLNRFLRQQNKP